MKKVRIKGLIYILIIIVICILVFFGYYFFKGEKNPLFSLIKDENNDSNSNTIANSSSLRIDNYNGIYTYKEALKSTKFIYSGCSINNINYNILVINDKYYSYKSSCMGTYLLGEGNTSDLDIEKDEEKNIYIIHYNDKDYDKDYVTDQIVLNNDIAEKLKNIDLSSFDTILKETEFKGNYYDISARISGISSNLRFNFKVIEDGNRFDISISPGNQIDKETYKYTFYNYDTLPKFYPYGKSIVVLEQDKNKDDNNKYAHRLKAINLDGVVYSVENTFPITVDNITLTVDNNIYITFDEKVRYFKMFVGVGDKMCVENSDSTNITYYEFKIDYDYGISNFSKPMFVRVGRENEGCSYINDYIGGN